MRMYPAYKVRDVLDEYAITFFSMLNEGYRLQFRHYMMLAQISDLPQLDKSDRSAFYRNLQWATTDPSDILNLDSAGSSDSEIKKALGG